VIEVINKLSDPPQFNIEDQRLLSILAYQAGIAVRNAKSAGDRRNFFVNAIEMFITAIESTGFVQPGHCMRVARSSMGIAHKLGIEHDDLYNLYYASALHDIGVLSIGTRQSSALNSPCPRYHASVGAEMVRPVNLLAKTEPIIRHHHEAWDGSGYPDGISGNNIPLGARVVALAEAYEESGLGRDFVAVNAGKLFDPDVVNAFLRMEL
jgi:response regulator RpfG family c-di-GMP phosphodiesterase